MDEHTRDIIRAARGGDPRAWERIEDALNRRVVFPKFFYCIEVWEFPPIQWDDKPDYYFVFTKPQIISILSAIASKALIENGDADLVDDENPKNTIRAWIEVFDATVKIERRPIGI